MRGLSKQQANLLLVMITIVWGSSYIFMKLGLDSLAPFTFTAWRFGIAFVIIALLLYRKLHHTTFKVIGYSMILGFVLAVIFVSLLYGMRTTDVSTSGFLVSTTVIIVPLLQAIIYRVWPSKNVQIGVVFVTLGLALLTLKDELSISLGAILCLCTALFNAIYMVLTNMLVKQVDSIQLGVYQLFFTALFTSFGMIFFETPSIPSSQIEWLSLLGLAILCTAFGFVMQPIALKYTSANNAGFIFSLEPIFASILAAIIFHENIGIQGYIGSLIILIGVFIAISNFKPRTILIY